MKLGKRDFRHGFFHQVFCAESQKFVGFDPPGLEGTWIGRFLAMIFGLSQAPAKFQMISKGFIDILIHELQKLGFRGLVMAMYVDDQG